MEPAETYGALLALIEIGLGSLLHAVQAPFAGFFLSLNQGFILSRAVKMHPEASRFLPSRASHIAALLKSLSPAGERLGPMIAIAAQGMLFNVGTILCGGNILGVCLGMILLCLWSYVQIFIFFTVIFGKQISEVVTFYLSELEAVTSVSPQQVFGVLLGVVAFKLAAGMALGVTAFFLPERHFERYRKGLSRVAVPSRVIIPGQSLPLALRGSLRDLVSPIFLFTFVLMAVFFALSGTSWQKTAILMMRPLAIGFLVFFAVRAFPVRKLLPWLEQTRFRDQAQAVARAFEAIQKRHD